MRPLPGIGIEAEIAADGGAKRTVRIGNASLPSVGDRAAFDALRANLRQDCGHSHELFITVDGAPAGMAILREHLRSSAKEAFAALRRMGIGLMVMTGDRPESVRDLGIEDARAGLLPMEKERLLEKLQAEGRRALYVGDGINDSPALARAHASLALVSGSALAGEAADARLCSSDLGAIPGAIALARKAVRVIRQNLWFALFYNIIGIGLAGAGVLHPVAAALLMLASSLTVTGRALRFMDRVQEADGFALSPAAK